MIKTISILVAVTSYTAHGLSISKSILSPTSLSSIIRHPTHLKLGPIDDLSDYGKQKNESELDTLRSKREQLKKAKLANIKPNDDEPKVKDMTDSEIAAMFANKNTGEDGSEEGGGMDVDALFAKDYVPDFKIKRQSSSRGLSSGDSGGVLDDPNAEDENDVGLFIDWTEDYNDENELHIPNRLGFTTVDWGNGKKGFVSGKLKKKDRKMGKFNKTDLKKAYEKLQQNGIPFVETSEANPLAEAFINKFNDEIDYGNNLQGPMVASTYPNPWKHALKSKSLPRRGSQAVISAAENACDRMGISSMSLYQVQNPWYYIGGSSALAEGMLDVIADDHSRYVGGVDMSVSKLARLQKKMRADGEFVSTNQFEFSLTNRKNMDVIDTCKKLGITPICTNVLDGGLATGKYTSTNPTGGEVSKGEGDTGPYAVRKLEKMDALFKLQDSLREKIDQRVVGLLAKYEDEATKPKINRDITTTQIAINYVRAKGAVPLVSVTNLKMANELLGCLGWDLTEEEVEELDKVCKSCGV